ncbi:MULTISPECIES: efflux RND transporter permease subunit [Gemmata]|uniref:efflux RND transporter permease subunit n=1 Tax=Gemmata sp. SH-PL17 TaxID=1630693 RepID=UPI000696323F
MIFSGRAQILKESNGQFGTAFLLAFVFVYMVLAAQFESFVRSVSVTAALALVIPFALLSLALLRTNPDLYSMIGPRNAGRDREEERHPLGRT